MVPKPKESNIEFDQRYFTSPSGTHVPNIDNSPHEPLLKDNEIDFGKFLGDVKKRPT